jgi:hypothetical protein
LLGDILRAQNKRDEALAAYENSLQINPQQEDVLSLVCDLIPPEITNCDRLAVSIMIIIIIVWKCVSEITVFLLMQLWASRAAKSGFLEVAEKFRRCQDATKSASLSDSKLNRVLKNMTSNERVTPVQKSLNGMIIIHSPVIMV